MPQLTRQVPPGTPAAASGSDTGQSSNDQHSKNPYYRDLTPLPTTRSRSASEEGHDLGSGRVKPIRPVFHDLPTAHSSITSGSARSGTRGKGRRPSDNLSEAYEEENSIPLQEFDPLRGRKAARQANLDYLPLPPAPVAFATRRVSGRSAESDASLFAEDDKFTRRNEEKLGLSGNAYGVAQPSSMFANVKSAFSMGSTTAVTNTPSRRGGSRRKKGKQRTQHPEHSSSIYPSGLGDGPAVTLPSSSANKAPLDHPRKHGYESYNDAITFPNVHSTPTLPEKTSEFPQQSFKTTRVLSNAPSSLPEGSTVGNIYKHYAHSDRSGSDIFHSEYEFEDYGQFAGTSSVSRRKGNSAKSIQALQDSQRKQEISSGSDIREPPGVSLPRLPELSTRMPPSASQGIANSSSYGDTHNLLDLSEPGRWVGARKPGLKSLNNGKQSQININSLEIATSSRLGTSYLNPNNPYHSRRGLVLLNSQSNGGNDSREDHLHYNHRPDRHPLERDVSDALRRASKVSAYSNGSISSSVLEHYGHYQSDASSNSNGMGLLKRQLQMSPPSDPDFLDEETRAAAAQAQLFYEKGAIPSGNWLASKHNEVRIPINQNGKYPNCPPAYSHEREISDQQSLKSLAYSQVDDANDWETVGESAFGAEGRMGGGGYVKQAGSSIADTSDEGSVSSYIPELGEYGSTERIAQHPAGINYSGDYRQRDLKNTQVPVFLPVYREHKVNGYLANSNRTRPPPHTRELVSTALARKHTNPFKSPPPEVMTIGGSKPFTVSTRERRNHKLDQFPTPTSIATNLTIDEHTTPDDVRQLSKRPARAFHTPSRPDDWTDDYGSPGPEINFSRPHPFLKPISPVAERPTSWGFVQSYARGEKVKGYDENGKRLPKGDVDALSEESLDISDERANAGHIKHQTDGFIDAETYGGKKQKERGTLVKGPPGAFYRGLLGKTSRTQSEAVDRHPKAKGPHRQLTNREYPTNVLRPLALTSSRQHDRPMTPSTDPEPSEPGLPNDFVYRSPLAPIKRSTWKELYTPGQLIDIRTAAQADGIFDNRASQALVPSDGPLNDPFKESSSRKHLYESPRLHSQSREPSAFAIEDRKRKISLVVLCLCNIFPPSLAFFLTGNMDKVMVWWTDGESIHMYKNHKRYALWLVFGWCIIGAIILIIFLVFWFLQHKHLHL